VVRWRRDSFCGSRWSKSRNGLGRRRSRWCHCNHGWHGRLDGVIRIECRRKRRHDHADLRQWRRGDSRTGNGGAAGSINLVLGTGGASAGGTAGAAGQLLVNGTAGIEPISFIYSAPDDQAFFVANRSYRVIGITFRPLVVGSDMSAVTATIKKAGSGTAIASGTTLHTGSADLKGTAYTNQTLTLSSTSSGLDIASGDAIGIDVTGTTTAARGVVTVLLNPR
jgi:hypothetical protein